MTESQFTFKRAMELQVADLKQWEFKLSDAMFDILVVETSRQNLQLERWRAETDEFSVLRLTEKNAPYAVFLGREMEYFIGRYEA